AGAFDPVNMLRRTLLEENRDPVTGIANPAREFLELRFQNFVIGTFHIFGDARLERDQPAGDRVRDKVDIAHPKLAASAKIGVRFHRIENDEVVWKKKTALAFLLFGRAA